MILGITGRAGAGKSTLADMIAAHVHGVRLVPFAQALRDVVEAAFGSRYETQEAKARPDPWWSEALGREITGREILQRVGTELFRDGIDTRFWCLAWARRIQGASYHVLVPDVRFDNEAQWIISNGGLVIRLTRLGGPIVLAGTHRSEMPVSPAYVAAGYTPGSLDELETLAAFLARRHFNAEIELRKAP